MTTIDELQREMAKAAEALDYERARKLRDQIALVRAGASLADAEASDGSGLTRQQPGSMGLGTSQQRVRPPAGWKPPSRPDPMTSGKPRRRGRGEQRD